MEVAWFEKYGLDMRPDIVVLNMFINDAEPTPIYTNIHWWDKYLYSRIIFFGAFDTLSRRLLGEADWQTYYNSLYQESADGWLQMQNSVSKLVELCEEKDIQLVLANYPELRQLNPYPFNDINTKLSMLASKHNTPYINLLDSVDIMDPRTLWVSRPDPHPNSRATSLFSNALKVKIVEDFQYMF
jgi:hypothetical protein